MSTRPISYSRINSYTYTCPFAYYLRYVADVKTEKTSLSRVWGSSLHKAIELYHLAGDTGDLEVLMNNTFIEQLVKVDEVLGAAADNLRFHIEEYRELLDTIPSTNPLLTKLYKDSAIANLILEYRAATLERAEQIPEVISYSPREDIWQRLIQHQDIAARYLTFHELNPLAHDAAGPMVERTYKVSIDDVPVMAIIDQVRHAANTDRLFLIDLKSDKADMDETLLRYNHQFAHYQLVCNFMDPFADTGIAGAGRYGLRTGTMQVQPPLEELPGLADEWLEQIQMVIDAEKARIFPRRRDHSCERCDYYETHCRHTTGRIREEG